MNVANVKFTLLQCCQGTWISIPVSSLTKFRKDDAAKKTKQGAKIPVYEYHFQWFFGQGLSPALTNLWTPHKNSATVVKQDTIGTVFTQKNLPTVRIILMEW